MSRKHVLPICFALMVPLIALAADWGGIANGPEHDGHTVTCDVPETLRQQNTGGTDGAGLCVWASTQMAAWYQNVEQLRDLFEKMKREPGGGWPERVDQKMKDWAPGVPYKQFVGSGWGDIDEGMNFIREYADTTRPVMVTYGYGELYNNQTIAHMVLCVGMDDEWTTILDNNDTQHIWWIPTKEFKRRFGWPNGQAWAWVILAPPPPPVPHNLP